jgi:hypothetical protein
LIWSSRGQFVVLALLISSASTASAQGISLRWTNCMADGGTRNAEFACDTNSGQQVLVTSFVLAAPLHQAGSAWAAIDVIAPGATLPAWWNLRGCRGGSEQMNPGAVSPVHCTDPWPSSCADPGGIYSVLPGFPTANRMRILMRRMHCDVFPTLAAGTEYLGPPLSLSHIATVGSPSCADCSASVCIVLSWVQIDYGVIALTLTDPAVSPHGNIVTWQGAGVAPGGSCLATTPTRRTVWGAVKALYR